MMIIHPKIFYEKLILKEIRLFFNILLTILLYVISYEAFFSIKNSNNIFHIFFSNFNILLLLSLSISDY